MEKHIDIIKNCPLFSGIKDTELKVMLDCLLAKRKHYEKNSFIFMAGDSPALVGIVLSGSVHIIQEDFWGNRTILASIESCGLFGESFSCAEIKRLPVSVLAAQPADILLIDYHKIITACAQPCTFHSRLIHNMLRVLAGKNVMLTQKMEFLTRRTTREKLISYLSTQARLTGGHSFTIPFNRQELAEYLSVDRSAMSSELSKMRKEGILSFHRSQFELLNKTVY